MFQILLKSDHFYFLTKCITYFQLPLVLQLLHPDMLALHNQGATVPLGFGVSIDLFLVILKKQKDEKF